METQQGKCSNKQILLVLHAAHQAPSQLIAQAQRFTNQGDKLSFRLLVVVPSIPARYYQLPSLESLETQFIQQSKQIMAHISKLFAIEPHHQWLRIGNFKHELKTVLKTHPVDEILMADVSNKSGDNIESSPRIFSYEAQSFWSLPFVAKDKSEGCHSIS